MPIIDISHVQGAVTPDQKQALAKRLTELLLDMEGGARTEGGRAFASVLFRELPAYDWWVGGTHDDTHVSAPGRFLVRVTIPEGYMNSTYKSGVQADVTAAIVACVGSPTDSASSILVIIEEVTEGNWAAGGKTISLASIAETVGLAKDGERFEWVQQYFSAKAKQFEMFGYPADTGGLLKK